MRYVQIHMPRSRTWTSQFSEETTDTGGAVAKIAWQHDCIDCAKLGRSNGITSPRILPLWLLWASWRAPRAQGQSNPAWDYIVAAVAACSLRLGSKEPKVYPEPAHPDLEESRKRMGSERLVVVGSMLGLLCSIFTYFHCQRTFEPVPLPDSTWCEHMWFFSWGLQMVTCRGRGDWRNPRSCNPKATPVAICSLTSRIMQDSRIRQLHFTSCHIML